MKKFLIIFSLYLLCGPSSILSIVKLPAARRNNLKQENCSDGCMDCLPRGVCAKCLSGFTHYNGKCFDNIKVDSFIRDLSENMEDKQKEILEFLISKKPGSVEGDNKSMYIDVNQDYNILKEMLKNIQQWNVRQCRMKINEFVLTFEKNMNVLLSLTNLFEERSLFEVAKIKAKVLELLNNEKVDPNLKFEIINKDLKDLTDIIQNIFKNLNDKVSEYENVSKGKIVRYRDYFYQNFRKFFENTKIN